MRALLLTAATVAVATSSAGCGLVTTPPAPRAPTAGPSTAATPSVAMQVAAADRTHEYPAPAAPQTVAGGWRSPVQAVAVFADTYINWSAATVTARLRLLAAVSVGQARSAMALAAAQTAGDTELHRGGIGNTGTVEAVAPMSGAARQYVVVTRELTTAASAAAYRGLRPSWHVTLATVTRVPGNLWVVSAWQPQS